MPECVRWTDVHRYHDGELEPSRRTELEAHLADCEVCTGLLSDLQGLSALLAQAVPATMPAEAVERIATGLVAGQQRRVLRFAGWLTAVAAAVLLVAVLNSPSRLDQPSTGPARWETLAVAVRPEAADEEEAELLATAEWMAGDLATGRGW